MKYIIITACIAAFAGLTGCAEINAGIEKTISTVHNQVDENYCTRPLATRQALRDRAGTTPGGATIRITCPGD